MKKQIVGNHKSLYHIEIDHLISIWHKGYLVGSSPAPAMTDHSEMSGLLFLTGIN